jgi:uncharacterized protein YjbI with pentapeptide repeats
MFSGSIRSAQFQQSKRRPRKVQRRDYVQLLRCGVTAWNQWRRKNQDVAIDLSNTYLVGIDLRGADLNDINFSHSDLSYADLRGAKIAGANFFNANLHKTFMPDGSRYP